MINHVPQSLILNRMPVVGSHRIIDMAHDCVNRHLIPTATCDGSERMPEGVETEAGSFQTKLRQEFCGLLGYGIVGLAVNGFLAELGRFFDHKPKPTKPVFGQKQDALVFGMPGFFPRSRTS